MVESLFNQKRVDLPGQLILIPQYWDKAYFQELKKKSLGSWNLLNSDVLLFQGYTVIVGFLGYPHIITLLEFIQGVREKEVFFLGTAGSLTETINQPMILEVTEICSTEILDHFCPEKSFALKGFPHSHFKKVRGVTVDLIQRETVPWLRAQKERGIEFVEMELFPLRFFLGKEFSALVISSDLLTEAGIKIFPGKSALQQEFVRAYEFMVSTILTPGNN